MIFSSLWGFGGYGGMRVGFLSYGYVLVFLFERVLEVGFVFCLFYKVIFFDWWF